MAEVQPHGRLASWGSGKRYVLGRQQIVRFQCSWNCTTKVVAGSVKKAWHELSLSPCSNECFLGPLQPGDSGWPCWGREVPSQVGRQDLRWGDWQRGGARSRAQPACCASCSQDRAHLQIKSPGILTWGEVKESKSTEQRWENMNRFSILNSQRSSNLGNNALVLSLI